MDPISALAFASSIIQVVGFSTKIVSKTYEYSKSGSGSLASYSEVESLTKDLSSANKDLTTALEEKVSGNIQTLSNDEQALQALGHKFAAVADKLLQHLDRLKIHGRKSFLKSFTLSIKSIIRSSDLVALRKNLDELQKEMDSRLLMVLRKNLDLVVKQQTDHFNALDSGTKEAVKSILEGPERSATAALEAFKNLIKETSSLNVSEHEKTRAEVLQALTTLVHHLSTHYHDLQQSLLYGAIDYRYDDISDAYQKTYGWIFHKPTPGARCWADFQDWLQNRNGMYWINGKAGSGKSTLMKFIYNSKEFHDSLWRWSHGRKLVNGSFFFWKSGTRLQKTLDGLLRSTIYQILNQCPELLPVVFESEAARFLGRCRANSSDGLDEFEGDRDELLDVFKEASHCKHIKICLSSRPWVVFEDAFAETAQLKLQDLTYEDIKLYANGKFNDNPRTSILAQSYSTDLQMLIEEIIDKASGVFLWVKLVVKSLLNGLRNRDSIADLRNRLKILPADIEDLYKHLLDQVEPIYRAEAYRMLKLVLELKRPLSTIQLSFANEPLETVLESKILQVTPQEEQTRQEKLKIVLASRCAGMIEIGNQTVWKHCDWIGFILRQSRDPPRPWAGASEAFPRVQLLHQTVGDFLQRPDVVQSLRTWPEVCPFDHNEALLQVSLLELKRYPHLEWSRILALMKLCLNTARYIEKSDGRSPDVLLDSLFETISELWRQKYPNEPFYIRDPNCFLAHKADMDDAQKIFLSQRNLGRNLYRETLLFWKMTVGEDFANRYDRSWPNSMMGLAAQFGLSLYLDLKLKSTLKKPSLLLYTTIPNPRNPRQWPLPLVKQLLDEGESPNQSDGSLSPWQMLLYQAYREESEWSKIGIRRRKSWWLSWVDMCEMFVQNGADPTDICNESHPLWKLYSDGGIFSEHVLHSLKKRGLLKGDIEELRRRAEKHELNKPKWID